MSCGQGVNESYPAIPDAVPRARHRLSVLAQAAGASGSRVAEIELAVSEALTNAVVHAYRDTSAGHVHVTAGIAGGELWVLIADDGSGLRVRSGSQGLGVGLTLISQLSNDFAIVGRASGGTEIRMRFDLVQAREARGDHERGSSASASSPASSRFSTTT